MNCCPNCFDDKEIIGFIESTSTQKGDCDYCGNKGVSIIPSVDLYDTFQELFDSYSIPTDPHIPDANFKFLYQHFIDWHLFKIKDENKIRQLVIDIGSDLYTKQPNFFSDIVAPNIMLDPSHLSTVTSYIETWDNFKNEIKHTNRFFIKNSLNLDNLKLIFNLFGRNYRKGKLFYRARTTEKHVIEMEKMGRPPAKLATAGRANPHGISYLYLSNDIKTTIYEIRSTLYDFASIGEFRLKEEIKVASLRNTEKISPFLLPDIDIYLLYKQFILLLEADLIKPLRRQDSELDYLPTQYLCEFIKSLGYDGVEYSSSLNPDGFNIALFSDAKTECISTNLYEVQHISYDYKAL